MARIDIMNTKMLNKFVRSFLVLMMISALSGCSNKITWQEEVKLSDGRIIVVTQKTRCEGGYNGVDFSCVPRETWLTFRLPEFSSKDFVWNERLNPRVVNIHNGHLYVVGWPPTQVEFQAYGKQRPPYIGFVWENGAFKRIPFAEIPEAIYDTNMLIIGLPPDGTKSVSISLKEKLNSSIGFDKHQKRIDPTFRINISLSIQDMRDERLSA